MKTYSLESAFVRAYTTAAVAVQGVLDKVATLERITRPERQQWGDIDEPLDPDWVAENTYCDGSEQLAERESMLGPYHAREYFEPTISTARLDELLGEIRVRVPDDEVPNPNEPGLTDDELVAVRGLIQERYPNFAGAAASLADSTNPRPSVREDKQQDSQDLGLACVSPADPQPHLSALCAVLAKHQPTPGVYDGDNDGTGFYCRDSQTYRPHRHFDDYQSWSEHVAPLLLAVTRPQ